MEIQQNSENPQKREQNGEAENEKANYTSLPSDGPVSTDYAARKSDLQNTDPDEDDEDAIAGDLAGNASGNEEYDPEETEDSDYTEGEIAYADGEGTLLNEEIEDEDDDL